MVVVYDLPHKFPAADVKHQNSARLERKIFAWKIHISNEGSTTKVGLDE